MNIFPAGVRRKIYPNLRVTPRKKSGSLMKSIDKPIPRSFSRTTNTTSTRWITRRSAEWYTPKRGDGFASRKSKSSESRKRKKRSRNPQQRRLPSHPRRLQRCGERYGDLRRKKCRQIV